ncbi:MAG: YiiX/YebB-like N1pC/P60 family cysteine hydrolase [Parvibaculales bacterium]
MISRFLTFMSRQLLRYLESPVLGYHAFSVTSAKNLRASLQPGDVVLIDGNLRISRVIKFLTQSSWSHAAIYVGGADQETNPRARPDDLVEADASLGVIAVPLEKYNGFNTRICRPVNLSEKDRKKLVETVKNRVGDQYDLKNVFDLMRYLLPYPPVPAFLRRRMIALGSGDPTRAICSTLVAEAFQAIKYPILPEVTRANAKEVFHIRHHSLYTPRDFDLSPYFQIIKPQLGETFDHRLIDWETDSTPNNSPGTAPDNVSNNVSHNAPDIDPMMN